jgi:hypothetical protein
VNGFPSLFIYMCVLGFFSISTYTVKWNQQTSSKNEESQCRSCSPRTGTTSGLPNPFFYILNKCILGPVVVHPVPSPVIKNIEFSSESKITPNLDPVLANCNWWFLVPTHQDGYLPNTSFYMCYLVRF